MMKLKLTILISIFVIASSAQAGIYKWVDEEGNIHFSDESSEQYKNEELQIEPGPSEEEVLKAQQRAEQSLKDSNELEEPLKITPDAVDEPEQNQPLTLEELDNRCEKAIEEKLAPLREATIKECIADENLRLPTPREDCERRHKNFGTGILTVSGRTTPRMFHNLPECVEAASARKESGQR